MEHSVIINNIDRIDHLQTLVIQDLRDVGIKLPKAKKLKKLNQSRIISQSQVCTITLAYCFNYKIYLFDVYKLHIGFSTLQL